MNSIWNYNYFTGHIL